jgi:hypothetical protein
MKLTHIGRDSWSRPVYSAEDGKLYVDVDPRKNHGPALCTKMHNAFDGEPNNPIRPETEVEFIPARDTWN